jgi:hypothetical protein
MTLSAKSEAIAFRIWAFCQPIGWDADNTTIAAALGESDHRCRAVIHRKGWTRRIRQSQIDDNRFGHRGALDGPAGIAPGDLDARFDMAAEE